jgi:hypothetical protein
MHRMKNFLLCFLTALLFCNCLHSQPAKEQRYIPVLSLNDTSLANTTTNFKCQVLQLTTPHKQQLIMIVFVETGNAGNAARTKLRSNYMLKRERVYLRQVFFADVEILETIESAIDMSAMFHNLKNKYENPKLWSILKADAYFSTAHQRWGTAFASHR